MAKKKSPTINERREIDKHHHWKFGHDPADPDTHPDSGWKYFNLEYFTPVVPDQRNMLTGGPDSGHTCQRCKNNTYRIAAERSLEWILNQPGVEIVGKKPDMEKIKDEALVIWVCPSCGDKIQWRKSMMPPLKEAKGV